MAINNDVDLGFMKAKFELKDKVLFLSFPEFTDVEEAEGIIETFERYIKTEGKLSIIVHFKTYRIDHPKACFMLGEELRRRREDIIKLAIVAPKNPLLEVAIKTVVTLGGFSRYKFFDDLSEAKHWVNPLFIFSSSI